MVPYLFVLLWVTAIAGIGRRANNLHVDKVVLLIISFSLVLFAGIRDPRVGTDTYYYVALFELISSNALIFEHIELGFSFFMILCSMVSKNYIVFLFFIAIFVVTLYVKTIIQLVPRYETALYVFVAFGVYSFFFNGARQGIAAAICFSALPYLFDRKFFKYCFFILIASLFHKTAIVALPMYFVSEKKLSFSSFIYILAFALIVLFFLDDLANLIYVVFGERYAGYLMENATGGGRVTAIYLVLQAIILFFINKIIGFNDSKFNRLFNIYMIGLIPVLVGAWSTVMPSTISRLGLYFSQMVIVLWPLVFARCDGQHYKPILAFLFFLFSLIFFGATTFTFGDIYPYSLNSSISG